jgi:hypothetical protein
MAHHLRSWGPYCQRGGGVAPLLMAWHNGLRRRADWRGKKRLVFLNIFGESLLFKFVSSLS